MSTEPEPKAEPPRASDDAAGAREGRIERWREISRPIEFSRRAIRRARAETFVAAAVFAGAILVYDYRGSLLGIKAGHLKPCPAHGSCLTTTTATTTAQVITVLVLVIVGWALARDLGRMLEPLLERRVDPATAGTVGFLVRLVALLAAVIVALRIAGVLKFALLPGAPAAAASKKPRAAKAGSAEAKARQHPLVQQAQKLFDAEIQTVFDLSETD